VSHLGRHNYGYAIRSQGYWQIGTASVPDGEASSRVCAARLETCKQLVEISAHESADFVLVAGDISQANQIDVAGVTDPQPVLI
jgi:hypothetical protein